MKNQNSPTKNNELAVFKAFYNAIADLSGDAFEQSLRISAALQSELSGLDPATTDEVLQSRLRNLALSNDLLHIYEKVESFQLSAIGESPELDETHDLFSSSISILRRVAAKPELRVDDLPLLLDRLKEALADRDEVNALEKFRRANVGQLNEFRLQQLERGIATSTQRVSSEVTKSSDEFTHAQQAIAIHFLLNEAVGVGNIDTSRLMEFAHLLAAKKIPLDEKTGRRNIRNSGIKSAFNKAWKKEDANHLKDLRFVLGFFKPLAVESARGIQQAVGQLEKRIDRISSKLQKATDKN